VRRQREIPADEWQYRNRSSTEVRTTLLALALEFVRGTRACPGVARIALLGSVVTHKPRPKDVDLLVMTTPDLDLPRLAKLGRRLQGTAQTRLNSGADVFLADSNHRYLGRICHYRECHLRVLCHARHCGAVQHLADDLDVVTLSTDLIATPPIELWPEVLVRVDVPDDVEQVLLAPLRSDYTSSDSYSGLSNGR
jgi:predicted nucleotidyltransferase